MSLQSREEAAVAFLNWFVAYRDTIEAFAASDRYTLNERLAVMAFAERLDEEFERFMDVAFPTSMLPLPMPRGD